MIQKYVRVAGFRDDKYILFDFAIGDPALSVELILPVEAFVEFCETNRVIHMTPEQGIALDQERLTWQRKGDAARDAKYIPE